MFAQLEILLEKETQRDKQRVLICWSNCQSNRFCIGFHSVSLRFPLLTYFERWEDPRTLYPWENSQQYTND